MEPDLSANAFSPRGLIGDTVVTLPFLPFSQYSPMKLLSQTHLNVLSFLFGRQVPRL